jgi:transcriptional regulator of aromatic amino acid metabolism
MFGLEILSSIATSIHLLFAMNALAISFKIILFFVALYYAVKNKQSRLPFIIILLFITSALLGEISHFTALVLAKFIGVTGEVIWVTFLASVAWAFFITQYQSLGLFCKFFRFREIRIGALEYIHGIINFVISGSFLYLAFMKYGVDSGNPETLLFERWLTKTVIPPYMLVMFVHTLFIMFWRKKNQPVPRILAHQTRYFLLFIIPYFCIEILLRFLDPSKLGLYKYAFYTLITLLSTGILYYAIQRLFALRFLNINSYVQSQEKFNFLSQFRDILEQLRYATAMKELAQLTQTFFQTAFQIPLGRTRLYIRKSDVEVEDHGYYDIANTTSKVEHYIGKYENEKIVEALRSSKIFIRDEVHFTHFYENDEQSKEILQFLDFINADIFLPIFERHSIAAYIIVEKDSRLAKLFTNKERDEMLVFITYLSNIINILKYSNIELLHQRHKQITEELYHKHQEINQYKESIRSFMRSNKERKIGILFYKYRRFTLANEAAQELVGYDVNNNDGHPLTQLMRATARRVQEFKTSQTTFSKDNNGQKIIIAGIPSLEENSTILLMYYPEISDIIKGHFDQLKDPSHWDYMLYLETTQSGQIINQLIPGNGEKLLNFKINLLSTALSKKATLLNMPEEDLISTVEILHDISLRQTLHVVKLSAPEKNEEVAIKLLGLNPLLQKDAPPGLLEKLDNVGTLFIQNVEYLSRETQDYLAEFITFGFFHKLKSDSKIFSNVRIICSSTKNLSSLVSEDKFSKVLFNELEETSLAMPSLHELSEGEVNTLAQGFAEQIITTQTYKNLLSLTDKDKTKLFNERPLSLHEFRERVHSMLAQKSSKHKISEVTEFDPAYNVTDPEIAHAVRLGKKALKDPQIMAILWNKFKNQNKIATLLGVNRSSVNRRCQEYNLK